MRRWPLRDGDTSETGVRTLLELDPRNGAALRAGSVRLEPGQRVPEQDTSAHAAEELSLIVRGSLRGESGGEPFTVSAGEVTLIPAGEAHWAVAGNEGAEVFWVWFGDLSAG